MQKKFGVKRSTLSGILAKSHLYLNNDPKHSNKKRFRAEANPKFEEALYIWFRQKRDRHLNVSNDLLKEQAKIFGEPEIFSLHNFEY